MKSSLLRKVLAGISIAACSFSLVCGPVAATNVQAAPGNGNGNGNGSSETITPYSDYYEWVYMEKDGKLYKRLLNCTTGEWVSTWIYVRDL